ncbi:MAG: dihydroneopterin aldolase [Polyangiales bacterium]
MTTAERRTCVRRWLGAALPVMQHWIHLSDLCVPCILGVHPEERQRMQPVRVDLSLEVNPEGAAERDELGGTVDYAQAAARVSFVLEHGRFQLLETAAVALTKLLLLAPAQGQSASLVQRVRLRLSKPEALGGSAVPAVEIERCRPWCQVGEEKREFGRVDIIHESHTAGMYRLNIAPGCFIPAHHHQIMREAELMLTDGLLCCGAPIAQGAVRCWQQGQVHRYDNPTDRMQSILCIDAPPFIEADEIVVADGVMAAVQSA